ncbi:MAG: hypothetical protein ACFFEN_10920 [Candidatus Thorarchaeota archaeon]
MPDYRINDKWIMNRISSQSSSFSKWLSGLMSSIQNIFDNLPPEALTELKNSKDFNSIEEIKKDITQAEKEFEKLESLRELIPGIGSRVMDWIKSPLEEALKGSSTKKEDIDFELDLDIILGKRKSLSSALYDVSRERGIESEGLLYLIHALPDLEAFLYSTSVQKYYRDHTEHALRVAVLGDFLLEQDLGQGKLDGIISELIDLDKRALKEKFWWIIGLLHDIGYPLGKMTTAVNYSLFNQLLKCYPTLDLEFTPLKINLSWKGKQEDYLKIIEEGLSKKARELIREGAGLQYKEKTSQNSKTFLRQPTGHLEYQYKSQLTLDHGVISALSLLNGLGTPEEIKTNEEYKGFITAAKAIALHNFKANLKDYVFDERPLAFYLMLIDELQEWGRPIPIQVRDTYFTTELKKVTLLDELSLNLDEFSWFMKFKNKQAKDLMNFNFSIFSNEKKKTFGRLNTGEKFPKTTINLQNIEITKKKHKENEDVVAQNIITI